MARFLLIPMSESLVQRAALVASYFANPRESRMVRPTQT